MVKRNNGKRRGVQRGVEKHKLRCKIEEVGNRDSSEDRKLLGIEVAQIGHFAESCFELLCRISCSTYCLPMEFHGGKLSMLTNWQSLFLHYTWFAAVWTFAVLKTTIWFPLLLEHGLTVNTLISLYLLMPCMCSIAFGSGTFFKARETIQLVNVWKVTLESLEERKGRALSGFEDPALAYKVIGITFTGGFSLLGLLGANFIFSDLPVAVHNILPRFGIGCSTNQFLLQIFCLPLECVLQMQPILSAAFGAAVAVTGIDMLKVYYEELR